MVGFGVGNRQAESATDVSEVGLECPRGVVDAWRKLNKVRERRKCVARSERRNYKEKKEVNEGNMMRYANWKNISVGSSWRALGS
jgi:hypothetical protein